MSDPNPLVITLDNPQLLIVAGQNGAGKSTFSKDLSVAGAFFFDADKDAAKIEAHYPGLSVARNEFIKKQIQDVIDLTSYLNGELFEVRFTSFSNGGSSSSTYTANIFKIKNLETIEILQHFIDKPVVFSRTSNQILTIKEFITYPFIPVTIADELSKLYSFNNSDVTTEQVEGKLIIVINSKTFEETDFQKLANPQAKLRDPSAFAFNSFEYLIVCSKRLQKAIVSWLEKYEIDQINIRSYFWQEQ